MSKGISAVIATILLLLITITLATVAYVYVTNILSSKTAKAFQILSPACSSGKISFVFSNQGTQAMTNTAGSGDITITINNTLETSKFEENGAAGDTTYTVNPGQSVVLVKGSSLSSSGQQKLRVSTSSDSQAFSIPC